MKKLILLLVIAFLAIVVNFKVIACTTTPIQVQLNFPGCPNLIVIGTICCPDNPSVPEPAILTITKFANTCPPYSLDGYTQFAEATILANYTLYCPHAYQPCGAPPPPQQIIVKVPICWYLDDSSPANLLECNDAYCCTVYDVCTDQFGGTHYTPDPQTPNPWIEGDITDCNYPDPNWQWPANGQVTLFLCYWLPCGIQ